MSGVSVSDIDDGDMSVVVDVLLKIEINYFTIGTEVKLALAPAPLVY